MEGLDVNIKERIRRAGPTTRTHRVWLGADLDLVDEYEAAVRALEAAKKPADSLAGNGSTADAQARVDELRGRLDEFAVDFKLRGLDDLHYGRLLDQHPPRKTEDGQADERDADTPWNGETFPGALVRACTVDPVMDDDDWLALLGGIRKHGDGTEEEVIGLITSHQLSELSRIAFRLTRHPVDIPFSSAASQPTRSSEPE